MHKILIATDSFDQVNGVSTTYRNILKNSRKKTYVIHPGLFKWKSISMYPEVQLCREPLKVYKKIKEIIKTELNNKIAQEIKDVIVEINAEIVAYIVLIKAQMLCF